MVELAECGADSEPWADVAQVDAPMGGSDQGTVAGALGATKPEAGDGVGCFQGCHLQGGGRVFGGRVWGQCGWFGIPSTNCICGRAGPGRDSTG